MLASAMLKGRQARITSHAPSSAEPWAGCMGDSLRRLTWNPNLAADPAENILLLPTVQVYKLKFAQLREADMQM